MESAFAAVLIAVLQFFTQGSAFFFIIFLCGDYQSRKPNRNTKLRFLVDQYSLLILHRVAGHKVSKAIFPEGVYIYLNPINFFLNAPSLRGAEENRRTFLLLLLMLLVDST